MVKLTGTSLRACALDADCWTVSTFNVAVTTDAEKARTCCMYQGVTALASGTTDEIAAGDVVLAEFKSMGLPIVLQEAVNYCSYNYTNMYTVVLGGGVTVANNVITFPAA